MHRLLRRLTRADVPLDTVEFARFLIGINLVRRFADDTVASGRIVETEAYIPNDPASHAFRGRTARNQTMFVGNFHAYVYLIYGIAHCLNVSTERCGIGAAVLIRALEPAGDLDVLRTRRGAAIADRDLLRGPGRLCAALDIDRRFDGADFETDQRLWLADDGATRPAVGNSSRIGLTKAADVPLRFYAGGNSFVSGRRSLSPWVQQPS